MKDFFDLTLNELEINLLSLGYKKYMASQIFDWVYKKSNLDFGVMTNIKKEVRDELINEYSLSLPKIVKKEVSLDKTTKYLFELSDSKMVEGVLMPHDYGYSFCVSSEVGCNMGCTFCASGLKKKERNLTAGEMVSMILFTNLDNNIRISSVVIMGTGEPLDNFDNVVKFINIINSPYGLEIGIRHITLSTSGLSKEIIKLADLNLGINLAISLHAPNNTLRSKLMPINKMYPIEVLMDAVDYYFNKTKRRITFEYLLLEGINDTDKCVTELTNLVKDRNAYVNLIPYNHVSEFDFNASCEYNKNRFYDSLKKNGINVTLRRKMGDDIDAACGQLRSKY